MKARSLQRQLRRFVRDWMREFPGSELGTRRGSIAIGCTEYGHRHFVGYTKRGGKLGNVRMSRFVWRSQHRCTEC